MMLNLQFQKKAFVSFGILILAASFVTGCATPKPGSPAAVYKQEQKKEEARVEATKQTVVEIPSWYLNLPQDEHSVYASGTATSADLQLAMDKSVLNAKRTLADSIKGLLSSKMKQFIDESGAGEDSVLTNEASKVTTNLITEANVAGYKQADAKVLSQGKQYRVYVLLQYPLGKANKVLVAQVKKNRILEGKLRATKAFKDLEEEIKRARNP
ncbi:MAG: LPP20 family lipoprotein [Rhodospirillales bacterium]|jgi:hypothetical protein